MTAASALGVRHATVALDREPVLEGAPPTLLKVRRDGKPFLLTEAGRRLELSLPAEGRYSVALLVPGAGEGAAVPLEREAARPRLPALARLTVGATDERGAPVPARVQIQGRDGTPDPAFGSDEGLRLENVVYLAGAAEKVAVAPGSYRLRASRGPQHGLSEVSLRVGAG